MVYMDKYSMHKIEIGVFWTVWENIVDYMKPLQQNVIFGLVWLEEALFSSFLLPALRR